MKGPALQIKAPKAVLRNASATSSPVRSTRSVDHPILQLQRAIGNRGVQRFIRRKYSRSGTPGSTGECEVRSKVNRLGLQTDLKVNEPGDIHEQEADRIAEQVVSAKPVGTIQRKCAACAEGTTCPKCEEEQRVQPKESPGHTPQLNSNAASQINSRVVGGQSLPSSVRSFFEPRFGTDFSQVHVHTDAPAQQSARVLSAKAYTLGQNIVFASGQYAPHSHSGQRLLAHELVHVVQQRNGVVSPSRIQRSPDQPAGGCGLCYGEGPGKVGARDAGIAAHKAIQKELAPRGVTDELPWGNGRVDLAVVRPPPVKEIAIAEIKPANEQGIDDGIKQIEGRLRVRPKLKQYAGYEWVELNEPVKKLIRFETEAPVCPPPYAAQPGFCYSHDLSVAGPVKGLLYLYFCEPSYSELLKGGCSCECKEPKDKEPGPSESLPEQLLRLGGELVPILAAAGCAS